MIANLDDPSDARAWCAERRARGEQLGFVPTMGALHEGHLELVRRSIRENDRSVVSVFVNPLQFDDPEDLARYPRDYGRDVRALEEVGCDLVFTGSLSGFFAGELDEDGNLPRASLRDPGPSAAGLEGESRGQHFAGVATIVARLFKVVRPDRAYFGQKDFQQTLVVRDLAHSLGYPEIVVCPTSREASGLARSSRNSLLGEDDVERASGLIRALRAARSAWAEGEREAAPLSEVMRSVLEEAGARVDYAEVRDYQEWSRLAPKGPLKRAVALVAAFVGGVRLIDNLILDSPAEILPGEADSPDSTR